MEQDQALKGQANHQPPTGLPPKHRILQDWRDSGRGETGPQSDSATVDLRSGAGETKNSSEVPAGTNPALRTASTSTTGQQSPLKRPLAARDDDALGSEDIDEEEEEDGELIPCEPLQKGLKHQKQLALSKIQGTAVPRKPRVGPQYQALVPPWPRPPALPAQTRAPDTE